MDLSSHMGGSASAVQSIWSPEEELHFKKARAIQKRAAEYVIKNFFDGSKIFEILLIEIRCLICCVLRVLNISSDKNQQAFHGPSIASIRSTR